jgi:hypothetical protein
MDYPEVLEMPKLSEKLQFKLLNTELCKKNFGIIFL